MQTSTKVRLDILIEQLAVPRLEEMLNAQDGVNGYTVLPVHGGNGLNGNWTRDGQISETDGMMMVWCILDHKHKETVLRAVFDFISTRAGVVTASEVEVVRDDKF